MQQPSFVAGLYRGEPAGGGRFEHRLQDLWRENLGNGYNFTLLNISKDLSGVAAPDLSMAAYDALPHGAFSRRAHNAITHRDWLSFGGMITNLPCRGLSDDLVVHMVGEAMQWAKYLGMHSITFNLGGLLDKGYSGQSVHFYAELIARLLHKTLYEGFHFWIKTPFTDEGWCLWHELRSAIGNTAKHRLHVILDFADLDDAAAWDDRLARWYGESVQAVCLPTGMFKPGNGAVALPAAIQTICARFLHYPDIKWLIEGPCLEGLRYSVYRDHLESIQRKHPFSETELFLMASTDQLQRPMQPLQDQLHSANYELFEQDPVKYAKYEEAIRQALIERHGEGETVTVMVLGAGRGPLVDAALRAAQGLDRKLKLFVVEKNPPAVVTLKHRARDDWSGCDVTVVETDMRDWRGRDKADILVSELLGSWGDNELSPECLDGAMHLLKEDGISIPASYTSWMSPVSSARLHAFTASQAPFMFPDIGNRKFFESTYVVRMGAVFRLADEQPCFTFKHPDPASGGNERHAVCRFHMPDTLSRCVVHGFRGTFDCTLYGDIHISIADANFSEGMFCWFPLYIPLEHPLTLAGGAAIDVQVWRRMSRTRVWYEWAVQGHTHVHNQGGRSSAIGLY